MRAKTLKMVSAKEIAEELGISYQTLNYYTNIGLLRVARRRGNSRQYDEEDAKKRFSHINQMQDEGYPLKVIAKLINSRTLQ